MLDDVSELKPQDYQDIRRHAFKFIYQQEIHQEHAFIQDIIDLYMDHFFVEAKQREFLKNFILIISKNLNKCDELIQKYAKNWKLYRIAKIDLSILRVAITELLERSTTNASIIISDALNIAQEYASENSISFLNGILDAVSKEVRQIDTTKEKPLK